MDSDPATAHPWVEGRAKVLLPRGQDQLQVCLHPWWGVWRRGLTQSFLTLAQ